MASEGYYSGIETVSSRKDGEEYSERQNRIHAIRTAETGRLARAEQERQDSMDRRNLFDTLAHNCMSWCSVARFNKNSGYMSDKQQRDYEMAVAGDVAANDFVYSPHNLQRARERVSDHKGNPKHLFEYRTGRRLRDTRDLAEFDMDELEVGSIFDPNNPKASIKSRLSKSRRFQQSANDGELEPHLEDAG